MKKLSAILISVIVFFLTSMDPSYASLVVIDDTGQIVWNVLSEEISSLDIPRHSYIEVKKAAEVTPASTSTITLKKKGDKVSLVVSGGGQERQLDVSNWQEDLVEIEERPEVQKLAIGVRGDKFTLNQKGVTAETPYPISVDSEKAEISLETPTGAKFVSVLPLEAVESALRTNLMSRITDHNVEMLEKESELQYSIQGEKVFNFFKMFDYSIPVNLFVSASTGKVLDLEAPGWFRFINFLFV